MRPIGDALRWHGLNSLRAACAFGDKGSLFVSAMIFSCFLQGKTKVYCPAYYFLCSYESSVKRGVLWCRQPGLSISISGHKVVLGQVHALHEMRPISFRGASYAMGLCNSRWGESPGGATNETWSMRRNLRNEPMKCNWWDAFVRLRISVFRASMWAACPSNSVIFLYEGSQIAR